VYLVTDTGPDHQKLFRAVVEVGGRPLGDGEGRSKKAAEQLAAEAAWRAITADSTADDPEWASVVPADSLTPAPGGDPGAGDPPGE
jgi:ribonuclease-3